MLSSNDVREIKFSRAMGGYKQEEVDSFLDSVESDYRQYEARTDALQKRVEELTKEIDKYKDSQSSLQNILIGAQQLADRTVNDAKAKAAEIIAGANSAVEDVKKEATVLSQKLNEEISAKHSAAEKEISDMLKKAEARKQMVTAATQDIIDRQQALFDKSKVTAAQFRAELMDLYKKHVELIKELPDATDMDPTRIAAAVDVLLEKEDVLNTKHVETAAQEDNYVSADDKIEAEQPSEQSAFTNISDNSVNNDRSSGFSIDTSVTDEKPNDNNFDNGFFSKSKK